MKNLKKHDAVEMSIEEQRVIDGGVAPDEKGRGCTERLKGIFEDIINKGGSPGPYNPSPDEFLFF